MIVSFQSFFEVLRKLRTKFKNFSLEYSTSTQQKTETTEEQQTEQQITEDNNELSSSTIERAPASLASAIPRMTRDNLESIENVGRDIMILVPKLAASFGDVFVDIVDIRLLANTYRLHKMLNISSTTLDKLEQYSLLGWTFSNLFWLLCSLLQNLKTKRKFENELNMLNLPSRVTPETEKEFDENVQQISNSFSKMKVQMVEFAHYSFDLFLPVYELFLEEKVSPFLYASVGLCSAATGIYIESQ